MRKFEGKIVFTLVAFILFGMVLLSQTSSAADKEEILLGAPLPMTGILAITGKEAKWAYEQAVKDINAKGGVFVKEFNKKLPVRLIVGDAESDPGKAAVAFERFVKVDKVDFMLSSYTANLVMPTCIAAEKLKVYYNATMCFPSLWSPHKFKWSTLLFFELEHGAEVPFMVLDSIPQAERPEKIALLMEDTTDGRGFMEGFKKAAKKYKYNIAAAEFMAVGSVDYSSQILKLKAKGIDGAIIFGAPGDCITFVRQLKEAKLNLKYLHGYKGTWNTDFWNALGEDANYVLAEGFWSEDWPYPYAKELGEKYYKAFKKRSIGIGEYYALCQILFSAIEKAGTLDSAKVRETILKTPFSTVMGNIKYNADGLSIHPLAAFQWWNGQLKPVYPFDRSEGYKVKVAPPWNKR
jgi:branched-chain amino acid transport system substrate-binding protein